MAQTAKIPPGKKRYSLTLTQETMEGIQAYFEEKNIPRSTVSIMVDELIKDVLRTMQELEAVQARQGQPVGLGDLFTVMGGIMTDKTDEQRKLI